MGAARGSMYLGREGHGRGRVSFLLSFVHFRVVLKSFMRGMYDCFLKN